MEYWSWILACVGITGIFFVGRKSVWAWLVLIFNECLWIVYATVTAQYGFYFGAAAYIAVYLKNYRQWGKDEAALERVRHKIQHEVNLCRCGG